MEDCSARIDIYKDLDQTCSFSVSSLSFSLFTGTHYCLHCTCALVCCVCVHAFARGYICVARNSRGNISGDFDSCFLAADGFSSTAAPPCLMRVRSTNRKLRTARQSSVPRLALTFSLSLSLSPSLSPAYVFYSPTSGCAVGTRMDFWMWWPCPASWLSGPCDYQPRSRPFICHSSTSLTHPLMSLNLVTM